MILCENRLTFKTFADVGEPAYRDYFRKALAACRAMRIQKELAPRLQPFCNLLPWSEGWPQMCDHRLEVGYCDWPAYLDAYVSAGKPDFLCYDG